MHKRPDWGGGANTLSLNAARKNYQAFGVSDPKFIHLVRPPKKEELPENNQKCTGQKGDGSILS
jgi:hypothetical protein